jgi:4-amino-4-deoxy-L-arabinose transferase-like glycosyltransferase
VAGALLVFVTLGLLWVSNIPTYRPPDEASHVGYARELAHGRLPTIDSLIPGDGDPRLARLLAARDARHRTIWTANHPPLYYALAAAPLRIGAAGGHPLAGMWAARLLSVGLSAAGLGVLAYLVLQLAPTRPQLAVAATGLVALLPSFISISARVYNDSLAFLTSTAGLAAAAVFLVRGPSGPRLAAVAAAAGLAALTRASGLLVVGVAGLAVLIGTWRAGEDGGLRRLTRVAVWAGAVGVVAVAVAGWFYWRNRALYGDLTGSAALLQRFGRSPNGTVAELLTDPGFWRVQQQRLWDVTNLLPRGDGSRFRRLWPLALVPLAGLLLAGGRWLAGPGWRSRRPDPGRTVAFALCLLLLGLLQLTMAQFVSDGGGAHVRYVFPGLAAAGVIAAVGLAALPGGRRGLPVLAMLSAMAAINLGLWWPYRDAVGLFGRPAPLAAMAGGVLVGLGLQAVALWRLAPDPVTMPGDRSSDL